MKNLSKDTETIKLLSQANDYLSKSLSDATKRAYASDFLQFAEFCRLKNLQSLPATPDTVAIWITQMVELGRKTTTIERSLVAISQAHKLKDLDSPINTVIRKLVTGVKRKIGKTKKKSLPITLEMLERIITRLGSDLISERNKAILLLGWAGALRRSELSALDVENVDTVSRGIKLTIPSSKTDQCGEGYTIGIPFAENDSLCPVYAVQNWIFRANLKSGALFRQIGRSAIIDDDCSTFSRLSDKWIAKIVKDSLQKAGYPTDGYGGHSLRAGFATEAASRGVDERTIMRHTRHKSVTVMRGYIHSGTIFSDNPFALGWF